MGSLWNRSGTIERHDDDIRAGGAKAYFFQGGTTTPLTVYADAAEGDAHTHPVVADANGRWPDVFVPYIVSYDVQVTDDEGVQLTFTQGIPNPDPIDLSVTIPAENQVQTGMIHAEFVNSTKSGYVRLNGRTIGNASSSATERANADTSALFSYLWTNLSNTIAPVSGGRGASASADFAANKNIQLPDLRGALLVGLDDMGNSALSAFTGLSFTLGSATIAGSSLGVNSYTLSTSQLPSHTHTGTSASNGAHTHTGSGTTGDELVTHTHTGGTLQAPVRDGSANSMVAVPSGASTTAVLTGAGVSVYAASVFTGLVNVGLGGTWSGTTNVNDVGHMHNFSFTSNSNGAHTHTFTTDATGSGSAVNNLGLSSLVTWFIKL